MFSRLAYQALVCRQGLNHRWHLAAHPRRHQDLSAHLSHLVALLSLQSRLVDQDLHRLLSVLLAPQVLFWQLQLAVCTAILHKDKIPSRDRIDLQEGKDHIPKEASSMSPQKTQLRMHIGHSGKSHVHCMMDQDIPLPSDIGHRSILDCKCMFRG